MYSGHPKCLEFSKWFPDLNVCEGFFTPRVNIYWNAMEVFSHFRGLVHFVLYEQLLEDPLTILRGIIDFLNIRNNHSNPDELTARLTCLRSNLSGKFKRGSSQQGRQDAEGTEGNIFERIGMEDEIRAGVQHVDGIVSEATRGRVRLRYYS